MVSALPYNNTLVLEKTNANYKQTMNHDKQAMGK